MATHHIQKKTRLTNLRYFGWTCFVGYFGWTCFMDRVGWDGFRLLAKGMLRRN